MSRHHSTHAGGVTAVINDINEMGKEEAERIYGIEFRDDGTIYDVMYNRKFTSLGEWADFNVQQDEMEYEEEIGGGHDEFY